MTSTPTPDVAQRIKRLESVEWAARMVVVFANGRDECPFCHGSSDHLGKCPLLDLDTALTDYTDMEAI